MKQSRALQTALFACGLVFTAAASAGGGASGSMLGNTCAGCHGTDGASVGPAPTIGGMSAEYLAETMKGFRSGDIRSTIMTRIAKGYSDDDIDAMAKYFASETCVEVSTEAIQIHGGYGYTKDFPVEKFYRDSKLCTIGEGTSEIQKIVISREVIKDYKV